MRELTAFEVAEVGGAMTMLAKVGGLLAGGGAVAACFGPAGAIPAATFFLGAGVFFAVDAVMN